MPRDDRALLSLGLFKVAAKKLNDQKKYPPLPHLMEMQNAVVGILILL